MFNIANIYYQKDNIVYNFHAIQQLIKLRLGGELICHHNELSLSLPSGTGSQYIKFHVDNLNALLDPLFNN